MCVVATVPALAQEHPAAQLAPVVRKLLDDDAIDAASRRQMALFHGQWQRVTNPDLPERASIALQRYELYDEALGDAAAPARLRAQAALWRGDAHQVLELTNEPANAQLAVLRAEALDMLGRRRDAVETLSPWRQRLGEDAIDDAAQLTAAGRALVMLAAFEGRPAQDYHTAMRLFAKVRDQLNRLYWPAHLAEARLLLAKHNTKDASEALGATLALNPHCGEAWLLLGRVALGKFEFDKAGACEKRLRDIHPHHLLADLMRAETLLTQRDPQAAADLLGPVQEDFPKHLDLIALRAAAEALRYNDAGLEAAIARHQTLSPGNATIYHTVGTHLAMARQYRAAAAMFERAIELDPNWPDPRSELGLMLLQSGDEPGARQALAAAVELDPFHTRAANSMKMVEHLIEYEQIETEHFVIKHRAGIDRVLARDIAGQIEMIYDRITTTYGHRPRRRTLIEIMPDEQWFAVRITGMPWIWTIGACTGDVIALTPPRHGRHQHGPFDWFDVVQHEFVHTVTLDQTDFRIPHWFTEACAVAIQRTRRDFDACQLLAKALASDQLFRLDRINWAFVRPKTPRDRPLAYAQSDWMLEYITQRFGHESVIRMLGVYRDGGDDTEALALATGLEVEPFMADFKAWARMQVQQWGLGPHTGDAQIEEALASASTVNNDQLDELLRQHPDNPRLLNAAARRAVAGDDPAAARRAVLRYATARPVDPWPSKVLAKLALENGAAHEAIGPLERLDRLELKVANWSTQLSSLHRADQDYNAAAAAIGRAIRREPYSAHLRETAAAIDLQRRQTESALYHVQALAMLEPQRAIHHVRLAALYERIGQADESRRAAEQALQLDEAAPVERFLAP